MFAPDELQVPAVDQLPPDFAARTLIAQTGRAAPKERFAIQIDAREVKADLVDPRLALIHEVDSERSAVYRILRHRLVEHGNPRTIVISSAERREGKTTLAVNLALALAEYGRARVLLIEGNLRQPALARTFGFKPPSCLIEQIARHRDRSDEPWVLAQVACPWLHVLAVDPTKFRQPQVIDGPAFENGLYQLQQVQYDYLLIDTPPVLGNADVNLLQDSADAVLLTAWSRKTSGKMLRRAIDQLTPSKLIGLAVLNA